MNQADRHSYALAESAAMGIPIDGLKACEMCGGAGFIPSTAIFAADAVINRMRGVSPEYAPVRIGVNLCRVCRGLGCDPHYKSERKIPESGIEAAKPAIASVPRPMIVVVNKKAPEAEKCVDTKPPEECSIESVSKAWRIPRARF